MVHTRIGRTILRTEPRSQDVEAPRLTKTPALPFPTKVDHPHESVLCCESGVFEKPVCENGTALGPVEAHTILAV